MRCKNIEKDHIRRTDYICEQLRRQGRKEEVGYNSKAEDLLSLLLFSMRTLSTVGSVGQQRG